MSKLNRRDFLKFSGGLFGTVAATVMVVIGATFVLMALYAAYRMTQRATTSPEDSETYLGVLPAASAVASTPAKPPAK